MFTVSLHGKRNFPFKKATSDWDVEFEKGADDDEYLASLDGVLNRLKRERFDLIFFQAGVDTLAMDHLGDACVEPVRHEKQESKGHSVETSNGLSYGHFHGGRIFKTHRAYGRSILRFVHGICARILGLERSKNLR